MAQRPRTDPGSPAHSPIPLGAVPRLEHITGLSNTDLKGKVAIVTGGSRGIGRAICVGLAERGASVVVASRTEIDESAGTEFARHGSGTIGGTLRVIQEQGGVGIATPCDISKHRDIQRVIDSALDAFGRIDILVSNAGIDCESPVAELDVELLDRCLAVNVRGPILLCRYALPSMLSQGSGGSIFCITSGSALAYREGRVGYSMSKAAVERAYMSLSQELMASNIAVNALNPGRMDTWMNRRGDWAGTTHIPLDQPEVIIPAAVWLAAQTAETFTGRRVERAEFGETWGPGIRVSPS